MILNGKEYGLYLTTQAWSEIAALCPDGNFSKFGSLMEGQDSMKNVVRILAALSRGYADYEEVILGHKRPEVLTEKYLSALSPFVFTKAGVMDEITNAMQGGTEQEIQTEPVKGKNAEGAATA